MRGTLAFRLILITTAADSTAFPGSAKLITLWPSLSVHVGFQTVLTYGSTKVLTEVMLQSRQRPGARAPLVSGRCTWVS